MAYPNYGSNYAAGIPAKVVLSTVGPPALTPAGNGQGSTGTNYSVTLDAPGDTVTLTAKVVDVYGNNVLSYNGQEITNASFVFVAKNGANYTYKIAGAVSTGSFIIGETVIQNASGGTGVLLGFDENGNMYVNYLSGSPNSSSVWAGETSGATFTPTAAPTRSFVPNEQIDVQNAGLVTGEVASEPIYGESWNPQSGTSSVANPSGPNVITYSPDNGEVSTFSQDIVDVGTTGVVTGNSVGYGDIEVRFYRASADFLSTILSVTVLNGN
jgi:hypothetical protein